MRGYCPRCREYRSDDGENAWGIKRGSYGWVCEKCGHMVDVME